MCSLRDGVSVVFPLNHGCTMGSLTCHFYAPCKSTVINFSPCFVSTSSTLTYCNPTRLKVNRAIRMDSVEPLIEGVPTHDAA